MNINTTYAIMGFSIAGIFLIFDIWLIKQQRTRHAVRVKNVKRDNAERVRGKTGLGISGGMWDRSPSSILNGRFNKIAIGGSDREIDLEDHIRDDVYTPIPISEPLYEVNEHGFVTKKPRAYNMGDCDKYCPFCGNGVKRIIDNDNPKHDKNDGYYRRLFQYYCWTCNIIHDDDTVVEGVEIEEEVPR